MAMSPRLLRPRATGAFDAAAQVYFNAVAQADGQQLEPAVKKAINDFIVGCKADGIWSAIKASCILMGARTLSGALTPLVGAAPTNSNFVSGDYNRKTGLIGNQSTKYINSERNNNADPQDNRHLSVYVSAATLITGQLSHIGAGGFSNGASTIQPNTVTGNIAFRLSNAIAQNVASQAAATGFIGCSRSASASFVARVAGSNTTLTVTSETPFNENVEVFGRGRASVLLSAARLAFYSIGESLTLASLDSRVTTLYNAIGAAIP